MVVVLNMMDLARKKGITINVEELEKKLGVPVVKTVASRGLGTDVLMETIENALRCQTRSIAPCYSREVEKRIKELMDILPEDFPIVANKRFTAIKAIEGETLAADKFISEHDLAFKQELDRLRQEISALRDAPAYESVRKQEQKGTKSHSETRQTILHGHANRRNRHKRNHKRIRKRKCGNQGVRWIHYSFPQRESTERPENPQKYGARREKCCLNEITANIQDMCSCKKWNGN